MIIQISKLGVQTGTYEDITNSGNVNILNDYDLKKQIVDYHVAILGVEFLDDYFYQYFGDFVMPFVFSTFSVLNGKLIDPQVIKTTQFENIIAGYYSIVTQRRAAYKALLERSYSLRDGLDKFQ